MAIVPFKKFFFSGIRFCWAERRLSTKITNIFYDSKKLKPSKKNIYKKIRMRIRMKQTFPFQNARVLVKFDCSTIKRILLECLPNYSTERNNHIHVLVQDLK